MRVNTLSFEKYNSDYIKFNGNVKVKGKVEMINNMNNKIQIDRFCITRKNPENDSEKQTQCMDAKTLAFLHNNKDHRLKMICLGDTCIDDRHIKILNGDHDFKLKSKADGKCLNKKRLKFHEPFKHHSDYGDDSITRSLLINNDCKETITKFGLKWVGAGTEDSIGPSSEEVSKELSPQPVFMKRQSSPKGSVNFTL